MLEKEFLEIIQPILELEEFNNTKTRKHHGITRFDHSMTVAYITYIVLNCIYDDYTNMSDIIFIIILVVDIIYIILDIIKEIRLGKVFGKSKLFILGLILLSPIFEIILGMGKSKYVGNNNEVVKW